MVGGVGSQVEGRQVGGKLAKGRVDASCACTVVISDADIASHTYHCRRLPDLGNTLSNAHSKRHYEESFDLNLSLSNNHAPTPDV